MLIFAIIVTTASRRVPVESKGLTSTDPRSKIPSACSRLDERNTDSENTYTLIPHLFPSLSSWAPVFFLYVMSWPACDCGPLSYAIMCSVHTIEVGHRQYLVARAVGFTIAAFGAWRVVLCSVEGAPRRHGNTFHSERHTLSELMSAAAPMTSVRHDRIPYI